MLYSNILKLLKKHLQNHFLFYFVLFCSFILGNILGTFILKNLNYDSNVAIFTWFYPFLDSISKYTKFMIFKRLFSYNMLVLVIIIVLGIVNLGYLFIPIITLFLGTTVGFRVGFLVTYIKLKGFWLSIIGIYPQYIFFLISFLGIGSLSMSLSQNPLNISKYNKAPVRIIRNNEYILLFSFFLIFWFLGIITEVFCSPILKLILNDII